MQRGDVCLVRPDDCHRLDFPDNNSCQYLSFLLQRPYAEHILAGYGDALCKKLIDETDTLHYVSDGNTLLHITNTALSFNAPTYTVTDKVFQCKIVVNTLLNQLVSQRYGQNNNTPDWLTQFLFVLNNPYLDISDVQSLAKYTPYSYSRLARLFKEQTGRTIIEYVTQVKIKGAQELLRGSDLSILEIAAKLNYESISYFNRIFKRHTNLTPGEFRKKCNR